MSRPTRVDHAAVARALAEANAKTGLFNMRGTMADTAEFAPDWSARVGRVRAMLAEEREAFLRAWGVAPAGRLELVSDDPRDALGRAVIEAARDFAAAMARPHLPPDFVANASDRLREAVRVYDAAGSGAQPTEGERDGVRQG